MMKNKTRRNIIIILVILFIFVILTKIISYRVVIGDSFKKKGVCLFELKDGSFLPPRSQLLRGIFEHYSGKIYIKLIECDKHMDCDGDIFYFWRTHTEIESIFNKSLEQMEIEKKHPYVEIKVKTLLNGDFKIISVEKIKWIKGMPYSYN